MEIEDWKAVIAQYHPHLTAAESLQMRLTLDLLIELRAIREANETEAVEDGEPDPFQTLNGPSQ